MFCLCLRLVHGPCDPSANTAMMELRADQQTPVHQRSLGMGGNPYGMFLWLSQVFVNLVWCSFLPYSDPFSVTSIKKSRGMCVCVQKESPPVVTTNPPGALTPSPLLLFRPSWSVTVALGRHLYWFSSTRASSSLAPSQPPWALDSQ